MTHILSPTLVICHSSDPMPFDGIADGATLLQTDTCLMYKKQNREWVGISSRNVGETIYANSTVTEIESYIAYDLNGNKAFSITEKPSSPICFVCGAQLQIASRGRRKYCASCGCYLPEIIYDTAFTESVNPMKTVKPSPLPTVYTH